MTEQELAELGPVDFLVIEFPAGQANFTGEIGELVELEAQLVELLAGEDVERLANAMKPGSAAVTPGRRRRI